MMQRLTVTEFLAFCDLLENEERRFELISGSAVEMPPSSIGSSILAARIGMLLGNFIDKDRRGYITSANGGYELSPNEVRLPDVAYILKLRVDSLEGALFSGAPDLAVEVVAPNEPAAYVRNKINAYLTHGSILVWTVYPEDREIDVYRRAEQGQYIQTFTVEDTLDGGDILPGFSVKIADIFSVLD